MKDIEKVMADVYAMRRANGDWFVLEDNGRMLMPLFHSRHDALMARLRTVDMLLFSPIALDAESLEKIVSGRSEVDFCIVNNPFASLRRGTSLTSSQLASLLSSGDPLQPWVGPSRPVVTAARL